MSNIDILLNLDFKELKCLILAKNKISDIKVLEKIKLEKLEYLDLRENNKIDKEQKDLIKGKFNFFLKI